MGRFRNNVGHVSLSHSRWARSYSRAGFLNRVGFLPLVLDLSVSPTQLVQRRDDQWDPLRLIHGTPLQTVYGGWTRRGVLLIGNKSKSGPLGSSTIERRRPNKLQHSSPGAVHQSTTTTSRHLGAPTKFSSTATPPSPPTNCPVPYK